MNDYAEKTYINSVEKNKPGNGTSLLPFIVYKNHRQNMEKIKNRTDFGNSERSP